MNGKIQVSRAPGEVHSGQNIALIGLLSLMVAIGIGRFAFTPLLPLMQQENLLSVSTGGVLASVHFAGYLAGALVAAWLPARPRLVLGASLAGLALTTFAMGLVDEFAVWVAARIAAGIFSAFTLVTVGSHLVRMVDARQTASAQGWIFSGVGAGIAFVGLSTLILMAGEQESSAGWMVFGGSAMLVTLYALAATPGSGETASAAKPSDTGKVPLQWPLVITYGVMGAGYIIPATFLPIMARDIVPDPLLFGWGWPIFGLAAFASTIFASRLYARFTNLQIWRASQWVLAAGLLLPALYPNLLTIILASLGVGGTFMIITMAGMKQAHIIAPGDAQRHFAALTTSFAAGQMVAPALSGWIYGLTSSFAWPLVVTSLALAVSTFTLKEK